MYDKSIEQDYYKICEQRGYFELDSNKNIQEKDKYFCIMMPPPNVTGVLHIGHALTFTLQDIMVRYKRMDGYKTLYQPGLDHAGIATQNVVQNLLLKEGLSKEKLGREAFVKRVWQWKEQSGGQILEQMRLLGITPAWSRLRFTMDEGLVNAVKEAFVDLYEKGLIFRADKMINWCIHDGAISDIEVEHKENEGFLYHIRYFLKDSTEYVVVATTRPETFFGDSAVMVNPNDERYKHLVGKTLVLPLSKKEVKIIADEYVDMSFGTGLVKVTPAHDVNDYEVGLRHGLDFVVVFDEKGVLNENCLEFKGLDRLKARELVVKKLEEEGFIEKIEKHNNQVAYCYRCKNVVEPYISKQWFVSKDIAKQSIEQVADSKMKFFPSHWINSFNAWMRELKDWCISRQLWWGHRIPVYYSKTTENILVSAQKPSDMENWVQDEDVLDTWFSSALWPFETLGWPDDTEDFKRYYPLDCMVTGYDIIFFWVARMVFQGLHFTDKAPFKDVIIHGIVRDSQGRKMSKSLGNGVDPIDVINQYGVDSLRYFLATTASPGQDMRYSEEKVKAANNYLNKIWNSARFILMNIPEDYKNIDPTKIDKKKLSLVDKYILTKLENVVKNITKAMDSYEYGIASNLLYNFVYDDYCSFYLEMSKVTLKDDSLYKEGTYFTLLYTLKAILMMIYPFSPFISEEIYLNLPVHKDSIMLESYPEFDKGFVFTSSLKKVEALKGAIEAIRQYKVNNSLAPNEALNLYVKASFNFEPLTKYLARYSFAKSLTLIKEDKDNTTSIVLANLTLFIDDSANKEELKAKLTKDLEKIESEIKRSEALLTNQNFLAKAPKQKIDLEKEKFEQYKVQKEEIQRKIENL